VFQNLHNNAQEMGGSVKGATARKGGTYMTSSQVLLKTRVGSIFGTDQDWSPYLIKQNE